MATRVIAGAMSGTSADGIDVAIVAIEGRGQEMTARLLHHHARPYASHLKQSIFDIRQQQSVELRGLARAGREISLEYAAAIRTAVREAGLAPNELAAVAAHGQTLFHDPPDTIQWIDPALLAAQVGATVISDFRRADCAAGGQGAPLVPFAEYVLFRHPTRNRVLLNIGGIANLTVLPAGGRIDQLIAFDVGPGNCISDWICRTLDPTGPGYDRNGERASRGTSRQALALDMLLRHDYFRRPAPKSTDVPEMLTLYRRSRDRFFFENGPLTPEDELATVCDITVQAIRRSLDNPLGARIPWDELIVSGGGTRNRVILSHLDALADINRSQTVQTSDKMGIPSEAKEAMAFALLGAATLDGVPGNVPSCTGANRAVVLGSVTPRSNG
jgi:anhydro-N-acetylmuramic acid kinase